jgi:hypothetical protein
MGSALVVVATMEVVMVNLTVVVILVIITRILFKERMINIRWLIVFPFLAAAP